MCFCCTICSIWECTSAFMRSHHVRAAPRLIYLCSVSAWSIIILKNYSTTYYYYLLLIISGYSPWQETNSFLWTAHSKPHAVHCFLICWNEVLELLLFNLWGIELDVSPIFTEVEMKLVWMRTNLSVLLMGGFLVCVQFSCCFFFPTDTGGN